MYILKRILCKFPSYVLKCSLLYMNKLFLEISLNTITPNIQHKSVFSCDFIAGLFFQIIILSSKINLAQLDNIKSVSVTFNLTFFCNRTSVYLWILKILWRDADRIYWKNTQKLRIWYFPSKIRFIFKLRILQLSIKYCKEL